MKNLVLTIILAAIFSSCKKGGTDEPPLPGPPAYAPLTYRGADLSFLPEIEQAGTRFYNGNTIVDPLVFMKSKGVNLVRLRLWHTPATGHSNYSEVEAFAQRIKAAGLNWWLNIHYSDTWADPANQTIPAAWQGASQAVLADSVYNYTLKVMTALKAKGCLPVMVQIGNETNSGFLWDKGKVGGSFDTNWPNYAALVKKAADAIKATDPSIKVMLHFAGTSGAQWYYNNLKTQGVNYDVIGISYYYWWHNRSLAELKTDLDALATTFDKDVFIAETAYPFSNGWNDFTNNVVGSGTALLNGYDASPAGQLKYLADLRTTIHNVSNNRGIGFCYWSPDWVAYRGPTASNGSAWENLALFDFTNAALSGWNAFAP